ncbi:hypothetical protein ACFO4N_13265 [Camelliibacillus cellulosilyticus]|uniref:Uncharacterized protein n=1 Tax=Camelliibacillus cellulosilyticus TaxID=2174486 RepID=A0ABV9GRV5_9BACL
MKKWVIAIVIALIIVGTGAWYFHKVKAKQPVEGAIIPTAVVQKGNLESTPIRSLNFVKIRRNFDGMD